MKASLIIATYNQARNLELILESVGHQTSQDIEIVIADDGSTDHLPAVIQNYQETHKLPITIVSQENKGFRKTMILNKAISVSKGEYLIFIDGDMVLHSRFIENHLRYQHKNRVLCGHRGIKISESFTAELQSGKEAFSSAWISLLKYYFQGNLEHPLRNLMIHNQLLRKLFVPERNNLSGCNFSLYREAIEKVNGFNEDILEHGYNDFELGHRLQLAGYELWNVSKLCNTYHLHHPSRKKKREEVIIKKQKVRERTEPRCQNGLEKQIAGG